MNLLQTADSLTRIILSEDYHTGADIVSLVSLNDSLLKKVVATAFDSSDIDRATRALRIIRKAEYRDLVGKIKERIMTEIALNKNIAFLDELVFAMADLGGHDDVDFMRSLSGKCDSDVINDERFMSNTIDYMLWSSDEHAR